MTPAPYTLSHMPSQQQISELYDLYTAHPAVTTDSRYIPEGAIFFALRGPSFDGNAFAAEALRKGAALAVVNDPEAIPSGTNPGRDYFLVDNVLQTLQELAAMHRTRLGIPILAITGTNGKTTTKELVHAVLSQKYRVYATQGNLNNHIGVPLTLLAMPAGIEFGIVEMGASAPGEIAALCRIAKPDYGIVTNIGKAHLEGFGDEEGVKAAKGELYDRLAADGGVAFVRQDDATLAAMAAQRPTLKTVRYGAEAADGLKSQLVGNYNRFNIAAAATIGRHFGVGEKELYGAIRDYAPTINRSQIIRTKNNIVIADCYNANPSSMRAALDWFGKLSPYDLDATKSEKIAILGDMLELGKWSAAEHRAILELILGMDFKRVVLIGQEFCDAAAAADLREATQKMSLMTFPDMDAALFYLRERLAYVKNKVVLLKGSRGMALERIVRYL